MEQNIYLSSSEYENAATSLAQTNTGLVLLSGFRSIDTTESEKVDLWTYRAVWYEDNGSLPYAQIEQELLQKKVITQLDLLPLGTYAAILPEDHYCKSEIEVLSHTANLLSEHGYRVIVLSLGTHTSGTSTGQNGHRTTSIVVKNIEKDLGVDLDVRSDTELYSVLKKNGADPLPGLLRMAYGTKKKSSEKQR